MTRRWLTAEDVRRAEEGVLVVGPHTVVTPQALEAARAAGVEIRGVDGPYAPPAPDRGPDAGTLHRLPHLPEPIDDASQTTAAVVTAVGANRPGVLAELTREIAALGCDVQDVSQKSVGGYFHLVLVVDLPPGVAFPDLKAHLECLGGPEDYAVRVMHERVFRFMHRI